VSANIEVETIIRAAPEVVFDLELDMEAHAASLSGTGETFTTNTGLSQLQLGDEVTFVARHLGVRQTLTSRVTAYDRPLRFVDEQTKGPFRAMRHEHLFEGLVDGTTRMTDRLSVAAPLGPLGEFVMYVGLAKYLRRLLVQRAGHIKALAEL
jgi:ligand-binding SRPBCC domain-containing protein